jgi:hypothetical protein
VFIIASEPKALAGKVLFSLYITVRVRVRAQCVN